MNTDPLEKPEPRRTETAGESNVPSTLTKRDRGPRVPLPDDIGPYKVLDVLGEGGMGVVYLAEQTRPIRRRVALKIIKLGMDTKQVIARFETERQALAMMNHPGVAKVFDAGATEQGRPYFVMEYVPGVPITEHCDRHKLNIEERLNLFMQLCDAVQHAHQKGVIHRDIKPKNVLVSVKDEPPHPPLAKGGPGGVPTVIDFGVAKAISQPLTEKTLFTEQGQLIGTPAYMSPEQAEMTAQDIDTRTDIYSLGVLLYELLTGDPPLDPKSLRKAAFEQVLHMIREFEPPKPSTRLSTHKSVPRRSGSGISVPRPSGSGLARLEASDEPLPNGRDADNGARSVQDVARHRRADPKSLVRQLRGDLDWITMKAMEKDRTRRYASASALADDIARHLKHELVVAGPPSAAYRVKKLVWRNKRAVAAAAAMFVALSAGLISSTWLYRRAEAERVRAVAAERLAQQRLFDAQEARKAETKQRKLAEENAARAEKEAVRAKTEARKSEQVTSFLQKMLASIDPARAPGPGVTPPPTRIHDITVREVLDEASKTIGSELGEDPVVQAAVRTTIAETYEGLGLWQPAQEHVQWLIEHYQRELGEEHEDTLWEKNRLGVLVYFDGQEAEAVKLQEETLALARSALGEEHLLTVDAMHRLGNTYRSQGNYGKAETLLERAYTIAKGVYADDWHCLSSTSSCLGLLYRAQGRLTEAEKLYLECIESHRHLRGPEDPWTIHFVNELEWIYLDQGRYAERAPHLRQTLATSRHALGDKHPETVIAIRNLASALRGMGDLATAEARLRAALALTRLLGEDHVPHPDSLADLAVVLAEQGKYAEAEGVALDLLETERRHLGELHPDTLRSLRWLGSLAGASGEHQRAGDYISAYLAGWRERARRLDVTPLDLNDYAWTLLTIEPIELRDPEAALPVAERAVELSEGQNPWILDTLALVYKRTGDLDRAINTQKQALALCRELLELRRRLQHMLLSFLEEKGDLEGLEQAYQMAEQVYRDEVQRCRANHPAGDSAISSALLYLGWALINHGKYAEAKSALRECLAIRLKALSGKDRLIANAERLLAEALAGQGRFEEAQQLFHNALRRTGKHQVAAHRDVWREMMDRASVFRNQQKYDAAELLSGEALKLARRVRGEKHRDVAEALCLLGSTLIEQGRFAEAESPLLEGHEQLTKGPGSPPELVTEATEHIVKLYEAWDAAEPGKGYADKAAQWRAKLEAAGTDTPRDEGTKEEEPPSQPPPEQEEPQGGGDQ